MKTTTLFAKVLAIFLCLQVTFTTSIAANPDKELACVEDFEIMAMSCNIAMVGSVPCNYVNYTIMYSSTAYGTFEPVGYYSIGTWHEVTLDGYYKLKVSCNNICHESNTVYLNGCTSTTCSFELNCPLDPVIEHCYDTEGKVILNAANWVSGCNNVTYSWWTPAGRINSAYLHGDYGYGMFELTVTCHDANCYYETLTVTFDLKESCEPDIHLYCPGNVWVDCDDELWDLNVYGNAYYIYHGHKVWLKNPKVHHHMNECNKGYITREWKIKDQKGKWHKCEQYIYVGEDEYQNPKIEWPKEEVFLEGCNPSLAPADMPEGAQKPWYANDGCSRFGHTYTDQVFYFNSTCKKVVRKWVVYDWCVYKPNSGSKKGSYTYYQKIKISNTDEPIVSYQEEVNASSTDCESAYVALEDLTVKTESCGDKFKVTNNSPYAKYRGDNASGEYPIGTTEVVYKVEFGCGYAKEYKQHITVSDDKAPVPYCIGRTVTTLMGVDTDDDGVIDDGMAEVWAKDFDLGAESKCGGELYFSFSPDSLVMSRTFTCADVGDNELKIYVSNAAGNQSYCVVNLSVQNNAAAIPNCERASDDVEEEESEAINMASVSGQITLHHGMQVAEASMILHMNTFDTISQTITTYTIAETVVDSFLSAGGAWLYVVSKDTVPVEETIQSIEEHTLDGFTNNEGMVTFEDIPMYSTYMLQATVDAMSADLINQADADRLYAHLVGQDPITDPYALLASDVDDSGTIDFQDLEALIAIINNGTEDLQNSWMLIDVTEELEDSELSWTSVPSLEHNIDTLITEEYLANFVLIYRGDIVDGQAVESEEGETLLATDNRNRVTVNAVVRPNPFSYNTTISVESDKSQRGQLVIYKINGEKVLDRSIRLSEGVENIQIGHDDIPSNGIYIYNIVLSDKLIKGKLMKIQ